MVLHTLSFFVGKGEKMHLGSKQREFCQRGSKLAAIGRVSLQTLEFKLTGGHKKFVYLSMQYSVTLANLSNPNDL